MKKKHIYIIGSKGIPAKYGGFETFVEKLTEQQKNNNIQYHVACMKENSKKSNIHEKHFVHNNADCFNIEVLNIGSAKAIYYDIAALDYAIKLSEKNKDDKPIFYVLACRIGPFIKKFKSRIQKLDGMLYVNPDGHEWLRAKWSYPVRRYWRLSERLMIKHADLIICDSKTIEHYIKTSYQQYAPKSVYIAYGTDRKKSIYTSQTPVVQKWFQKNNIKENNFYLVVGRFVPENNYTTIIQSFMENNSKKDLVLITNVEENNFYEKLKSETSFETDQRIKFVGTVYNQELLKYIREASFAYIHGHEVGGTNPSLLEALASTQLNLLLDVDFNREVGESGAEYWTKENLTEVIDKAEKIDANTRDNLKRQATKKIEEDFTWEKIIHKYEKLFSR